MKFDDSLWKAILEDLFADFLRFFFSNADTIFDMKKGFTYLDKEMAQIAADGDLESPRYVDKLVKIFTRKGNEPWVLVHVEVQGYKDKQFEDRMFTYYYRIFDRYRQKITAVVLLTDKDKNSIPGSTIPNFSVQNCVTVSTVLRSLSSRKINYCKAAILSHSLSLPYYWPYSATGLQTKRYLT